jgi:hypothetical protein
VFGAGDASDGGEKKHVIVYQSPADPAAGHVIHRTVEG